MHGTHEYTSQGYPEEGNRSIGRTEQGSEDRTESRDVKELRLLKTQGANGIYKYTVEKAKDNGYTDMFDALFQTAMTKVDYAGNICVIKCSPGLAGAACATIDAMNVSEVVGTIAGDDTIFMLCRTSDEAHGVAEALNRMIGR